MTAGRIATLRDALMRTPLWLGFNIELKYPTDAELAAMTTRFYSRNYFCDAVLKVLSLLHPTLGKRTAALKVMTTFRACSRHACSCQNQQPSSL